MFEEPLTNEDALSDEQTWNQFLLQGCISWDKDLSLRLPN
jgi:hypothetical protein